MCHYSVGSIENNSARIFIMREKNWGIRVLLELNGRGNFEMGCRNIGEVFVQEETETLGPPVLIAPVLI